MLTGYILALQLPRYTSPLSPKRSCSLRFQRNYRRRKLGSPLSPQKGLRPGIYTEEEMNTIVTTY